MNVAIVGCGVRGSIVAALLAGAGVEELSLVDGGFIEEGDIGASPLVFTPDLRAGKADALVAKLGLINPAVHAVPFPADLGAENAAAILLGADLVVDCVGDEDVNVALGLAASELELVLIESPAGYDRAEVTPARAVAVAAEQADQALTHRN